MSSDYKFVSSVALLALLSLVALEQTLSDRGCKNRGNERTHFLSQRQLYRYFSRRGGIGFTPVPPNEYPGERKYDGLEEAYESEWSCMWRTLMIWEVQKIPGHVVNRTCSAFSYGSGLSGR